MRPRWRAAVVGGSAIALAGGLVAYEATRVEASENGVPTVFIGDSITEADSGSPTDLPGRGSWLRYVVTDDRTPWRYVANTAVAGQTLGQMEARFAADVLAREPQAVVILGGTNDVRLGVPLTHSIAALRAMVEAADDSGAEVWIISPPPLARPTWGDVGPLVAAERALADELGVEFVELLDAVGEGDDRWRDPAHTRDGVHPTDDGAEAIAAAVLDQVAAP